MTRLLLRHLQAHAVKHVNACSTQCNLYTQTHVFAYKAF